MIDVKKLITNVSINLLRKYPFYGHVLSQLPKVYTTTEVPTLGVGKSSKNEITVKLYINTDYVEHIVEAVKKDENKVLNHFTEVFKHEVHHLIFAHLTMQKDDAHRMMIACELSANSFVKRNDLVSESDEPAGVFPEDYDLPPKLGALEYYDLLNQNEKYQKQRQEYEKAKQELSKAIQDALGSGQGNGEENDKDSSGGLGKTIDAHDKWKDIAGDEITKEMVRDIVRQANDTCKQSHDWGDMPGEIKEAIENAYGSKKAIIPWQVVLKNFLASSAENVLDYTMKRRSKRYGTRPGTKKEDVLSVAIGIDTSGSINDEALKMFFNELDWMAKTNIHIQVFEWDTQINREYDYRDYDGCVSGRGGTDPIPMLEEMEERKYDCVIMFTDFGFAEITKSYSYPILWVVTDCWWDDDYIPAKEGIIMKINKDKDGFELVRR